MEETPRDTDREQGDREQDSQDQAQSDRSSQTSQPYIGRWNQLVSTTNWEKGRIIHQWREALQAADAPASQCSDEAWSLLVGCVTSQHVGRLRRVYHRFGQTHEDYKNLYWSHFQAALDWEDAEMWLEGAVQNSWSVSALRRQRWETLGGDENLRPREEDVIAAELDEDFEPAINRDPSTETVSGSVTDVQSGPLAEGPDFGDSDDGPQASSSAKADDGASIYAEQQAERTIDFVRPFENLADLPDDLAEAFESFKLAIIRHKSEGWRQISRDDALASLDALKELALAPATDEASLQ